MKLYYISSISCYNNIVTITGCV